LPGLLDPNSDALEIRHGVPAVQAHWGEVFTAVETSEGGAG